MEMQPEFQKRKHNPLRLLGGALVLGLALWVLLKSQEGFLLAKGTPVPAFEWPRHSSGKLRLQDVRGKVVLLNFWATWCPPCVHEMPMLVKVASEFSIRNVVFVAANQDEAGPRAVEQYLQRKFPGLGPYVVYPDEDMVRFFKVTSYPTFYVLDVEGKVLATHVGAISEAKLRSLLEASLSPAAP